MSEASQNESLTNSDELDGRLEDAITALYGNQRLDLKLSTWLAQSLEKLKGGQSARDVFGLSNPEGAPRDEHGAGRYRGHQIAALYALAESRFPTKKRAVDAVSAACGLDQQTVRKIVKHDDNQLDGLLSGKDLAGWWKFDPSKVKSGESRDLLIMRLAAMAGDELFGRIYWPKDT